MKKAIFLVFASVLSLAALAGCGNGKQLQSGSAAGAETTASSQTVSSSEEQNSEADIISEQPEESVSDTADAAEQSRDDENESDESDEEDSEMQMNVQVGSSVFTATLEENAAAEGLAEMIGQGSVTIHMSDYSGFEKVGPLGTRLPTDNRQTTTEAGDIVLYQGNQIVMFYGSNSWSYTRLGHIDDLNGWEQALGSGDVTVTFSLAE